MSKWIQFYEGEVGRRKTKNWLVAAIQGGIARLREFLTSPEARLLTRGSDRALAELVLQAIHLQQQRKPIAKLEMSHDGAEHFRTLQAERVAKIRAIFELPKTETAHSAVATGTKAA